MSPSLRSLGLPLLLVISLVCSRQACGQAPQAEDREKAEKNGKKEEDEKDKKEKKEEKAKEPPKALFEWAIGGKEETKENGDDKEEEPKEEKHLDLDRPHFPEATTTVGQGRVVLEAGYTYQEKGSSFQSHSYPEALLRIGMFSDWFEFRITQNFLSQKAMVGGISADDSGAQDVTIGVKLALTEQKKWLPDTAIIIQTTLPTGARAFTSNEVLPGVNYDFSWELIKECWSFEGVIEANGAIDDVGHTYVKAAQGFASVWTLNPKFEVFAEWYAFYPIGAVGPETGPQHYADAGLVFYPTKNSELDIRAGPGLNKHATNFLAGAGFGIRY